ncbi:MAG: CPBP family intramembrane glutamic endopeptidase [Actinomycetota bacterium]
MSSAVSRSRTPKSVPEGVDYHRVLAGEKRRIGRGILAIVLLIAGMFAAIAAFSAIGAWIDGLIRPGGDADSPNSPIILGAGLVATALVTPWSMLLQRWLYGVPGPSLHSVISRFRFDLFGRSLVFVLPLFVVALAITESLELRPTGVWSHGELVGMLVVVLLLVPLQAAGEEYGLRGLVFRVAGSWVHGRWASLLLGLVVSSAVFSVIHTSGDVWWNILYVIFSFVAGFVTWRTGGLEIAVVIHAALNLMTFLFWFVLHADLTDRFDRSAGAVTPALFVPIAIVLVVIAVVVWVRTRRSGPAKTPMN